MEKNKPQTSASYETFYKICNHCFLAFWLRSSIVSVLISLITDMSSIQGKYIKWIFGAWRQNRSLLCSSHALTQYCSTSGNNAKKQTNKKPHLTCVLHNCEVCQKLTHSLRINRSVQKKFK